MSDLITAPGQTTTLTNTGTYTTATISSFSTLVAEGPGAIITVLGTTTLDPGAGLTADNGGELRLLGPFSGTVLLTGTPSVVELGPGTDTVEFIGGSNAYPHETNGTIIADGPATDVSVLAFDVGDTIEFTSPATSFVYTEDNDGGGLGLEIAGTLGVTETNGEIVGVTLDGFFSDSYSIGPLYAQNTFAIANGGIIYKPIVPPAPPTISGATAGQQTYQSEAIDPFAHVTISDPNANQVETVMVQMSLVTGTITDPDANGDGSFYNAQTGAYSVSGAPASVSQDLQGLVFTPNIYTLGTDESVTTQFQINVADTVGATASDDTTSVVAIACFAAGTRIHTMHGPIPVEALQVGMLIETRTGLRSVSWLGRRRICCTKQPRPHDLWPVEIAAGSFADGVPSRALRLSPDHAVFVAGALIPIKHLINGRGIAQIPVDSVEYWHVELDRHDVLLADGLPCESYLDTGNRSVFTNGTAHIDLHPDFAARSWRNACALLVQDGPLLTAVKQRLFDRGGGSPDRFDLTFRVLADGHPLTGEMTAGGVWRCTVPAGIRSLRLVSPAWMPAAWHATSLDRRSLGIRLLAVDMDDQPVGLESPCLFSGFHPVETTSEGTCRWTCGDARIVLPIGTISIGLHMGDGAVVDDKKGRASFEKEAKLFQYLGF